LPSNGQGNTPLLEAMQVTGQVFNNQHQPVFSATVMTQSAEQGVAHTDVNGHYVLYLADTGVVDVTAARAGFGTLPALHDLPTGIDVSGLDFVLPPQDNLVVNGGWEAGDMTGWQTEPGASASVTAAAAHTGLDGLRFSSPATAATTLNRPAMLHWQVSQTVVLPPNIAQPTLSWLYQIIGGAPTDSLVIQVTNGTDDITREIPLMVGGWTHAWEDLSAFSGQTVTLRIGFLETGAREVYVDEVSIGATRVGVYPVRLPLISRQ